MSSAAISVTELPTAPAGILPGDGPFWERLPPRDARALRLPDGILLQDQDDVRTAFRDKRLVNLALAMLRSDPAVDPAFIERRTKQLLSMEGPDHLRLRQLTMTAMSPRAVEGYRARMRAIMENLVAPVLPQGCCEAVEALLRPYPIPVVCALMGIPDQDIDFFSRVSADWVAFMHMGTGAAAVSYAAHLDMDAYLLPVIERRETRLGDDMLSHLLRAEEDGDRLTRQEIVNMIGGFLAAGTDTTRYVLGSGLYLFAQNPDQWQKLRERPELVGRAVDEMLRCAPAGGFISRYASTDVDVNGIAIPKGTAIALSLLALNYDPTIVTEPHRFDIERPVVRAPHLTFGFGPHTCLGLHLAKAELEEALLVLSRAFVTLELDGPCEWRPPHGLQGPTRLPIAFTASTAETGETRRRMAG
ncbi:cytochrome P450 [Rhodopseudomonas palustris]|uniref:Cytochrome P450 n=1 Tax=Rhodopseudomonas palustris TaxID=1076 RepID=A0A323UZU8_RHOPL|nr:cytochrome P450 [Rhodopseudomonas palustris]PZA13438.1 cytochrome P450 [Rhodopseudomonas palustris]